MNNHLQRKLEALQKAAEERADGWTKMPFGKYQNELFENIPQDYIEWVLSDTTELDDRYPGLQEALLKWLS